jgi:hypothetical protein
MAKKALVIAKEDGGRRLKTEDLYLGNSRAGGIVPAFNNIYDVTIDFSSTQSGRDLEKHITSTAIFENDQPPGSYLSLFCSEALLPGSQLQTSKVDGLRQGLSQSYALYRRYPDINLTWYSQRDYFTNDVFNAWMEFISPPDFGGPEGNLETKLKQDNPGRRMRYPDSYKCNLEITSFNRALANPSYITYFIRKAFPTNIIAAPLAYGKAELIKTTVSFAYETYYIDRQGADAGATKNTDGSVSAPSPRGPAADPSDPSPLPPGTKPTKPATPAKLPESQNLDGYVSPLGPMPDDFFFTTP